MRITEEQWKVMLRKSEGLQALARQAELRDDRKLYRQAWDEMASLHRIMRSPDTVVVRADGTTF